MNWRSTLLLLMLSTGMMQSALQANESASKHEQLKLLEYLIGGTWTTQGELPGVGKFTAERTYRWALSGNFIEQTHVMKFSAGEMETKGIIGWHPEKKSIVAWGFGSDGGIANTRATVLTPTEIKFEGVRSGDVNAGPIRATFEKKNENEFVEVAESKIGDQWVSMFTFRFSRTK